MKHIKFIALILSILCLFCSCSTESGTKSDKPSTRKAKVRYIWLDSKHEKHYNSEVSILRVDTLFKAGDTALIGDSRYIIVD